MYENLVLLTILLQRGFTINFSEYKLENNVQFFIIILITQDKSNNKNSGTFFKSDYINPFSNSYFLLKTSNSKHEKVKFSKNSQRISEIKTLPKRTSYFNEENNYRTVRDLTNKNNLNIINTLLKIFTLINDKSPLQTFTNNSSYLDHFTSVDSITQLISGEITTIALVYFEKM